MSPLSCVSGKFSTVDRVTSTFNTVRHGGICLAAMLCNLLSVPFALFHYSIVQVERLVLITRNNLP